MRKQARRWTGFVAWAYAALGSGGCLMEAPDATESTGAGIARAGDWSLPDDVRRIGNRQDLDYDAAGDWNGGRGCSGGLLDGTEAFRGFLIHHFGGISSIGGYSCRRNTGNLSQLSVHGTGRALDIMIRTDGGRADNDVGDPIANWLVTHAENVGVQYIIWDRTDWGAYRDPPKTSDYGGPIPHVDHIHMELTVDAAHMRTDWFTDRDGDGVRDAFDVCPDQVDPDQTDLDGDGIGDACDDRDDRVVDDDAQVPPQVPEVPPMDDEGPPDIVFTPPAGSGCAVTGRPAAPPIALLFAGLALVARRCRRRRS